MISRTTGFQERTDDVDMFQPSGYVQRRLEKRNMDVVAR